MRCVLVLAAFVSTGCFGDDFGDLSPVERDAGEAGIRIRVTGCVLDETGNDRHGRGEQREGVRDNLVDFELVDAEGTVVATTSTSATNVQPGGTYRLEMPLVPAGELGEGFPCEAELNLTTEPFG